MKEIALRKESKKLSDIVYNQVANFNNEGSLTIPENYSLGNAINLAYLDINDDIKKRECSDESKASALLSMAVMGLNPAKSQCYFIPMGGKLKFFPSYLGKICAVKRLKGVKDIIADVIYKETKYELYLDENYREHIKIISSAPLDKRSKDDVVGAWATILLDKEVHGCEKATALMTIQEIQSAWNMGRGGGNTTAHKNFTGEMAKKSVISRLIKNFIGTSDDSDMLAETILGTASSDYYDEETKVVDNTNKEVYEAEFKVENISFDEEEIKVETPKEEPKVEVTKEEHFDVVETEIIEVEEVKEPIIEEVETINLLTDISFDEEDDEEDDDDMSLPEINIDLSL